MPKTDPNTRPIVMWVRRTSPGQAEHRWPMDGIFRHVAGRSCPCEPRLHVEACGEESTPIWFHRPEMERLTIPNKLPTHF